MILLAICHSQIANTNKITNSEYNELISEFQRCSNITPSKSGLSIRHRLAGEETRGHCFRNFTTKMLPYVTPAAQAKMAAIDFQTIANKENLEKQLAIDRAELEAIAARNKSNVAIQVTNLQTLKDKGLNAELAAALINFINFLDQQAEVSTETDLDAPVITKKATICEKIPVTPATIAVPVPTPAVEPTAAITAATPAG